MKNREFSIEDAYQIFVFFMPEFWWNFLRGVMLERGLITNGMTPEELEHASPEEKTKDTLYKANNFVFNTVTGDPSGCDDYIEKIIEERMKIPPKKQHEGLIIKENMLFQLVIDFCNYFSKNFKGPPKGYPKDSLNFAIEWLEDMREHPKNHKKEWDMWNESILDVTKRGQKSSSFF